MSWASTISRSITTPNQSSRNGRAITGWIIHHNASMGGSYVLSLMQSGDKQVSANYQVMQDGEVVGVVPREMRSWSASNSAWDGASLTFEIANNSGAPGWTISEGAYLSVARTIAEDSVWAGIPINRTTVRGHREGSALGDGGSYATACPGGIDLDRLVNMANQIRSSGLAGLNTNPLEEDDMSVVIITSPIGVTLTIDGIVATGDNTPQEMAAITGAQRVTVSAAIHKNYLAQAAQRNGTRLICRVEGEPGVYVLDGGELRGLTPSTLEQLAKLGFPAITITPFERDNWIAS